MYLITIGYWFLTKAVHEVMYFNRVYVLSVQCIQGLQMRFCKIFILLYRKIIHDLLVPASPNAFYSIWIGCVACL